MIRVLCFLGIGGRSQDGVERALLHLRVQGGQGVLHAQRVDDQHQAVGVAEVVLAEVVDQELDVGVDGALCRDARDDAAAVQRLVFDEHRGRGAVVQLGVRHGRGRGRAVDVVEVGDCVGALLPAEEGLDRAVDRSDGLGIACGNENCQLIVQVRGFDLARIDDRGRLVVDDGGHALCFFEHLLGAEDAVMQQLELGLGRGVGRGAHGAVQVDHRLDHLVDGGGAVEDAPEACVLLLGHGCGEHSGARALCAYLVEGVDHLAQAAASDGAYACAVEGVGLVGIPGIQHVEGGGQVPAEAVAGHGQLLVGRDLSACIQPIDPMLHVVDLAERPAVRLDLHRVRRLVVACGVVGEFGRAEGEDEFARSNSTRRVAFGRTKQGAAEAGRRVRLVTDDNPAVVDKLLGRDIGEYAGAVVAEGQCPLEINCPCKHLVELCGLCSHLQICELEIR